MLFTNCHCEVKQWTISPLPELLWSSFKIASSSSCAAWWQFLQMHHFAFSNAHYRCVLTVNTHRNNNFSFGYCKKEKQKRDEMKVKKKKQRIPLGNDKLPFAVKSGHCCCWWIELSNLLLAIILANGHLDGAIAHALIAFLRSTRPLMQERPFIEKKKERERSFCLSPLSVFLLLLSTPLYSIARKVGTHLLMVVCRTLVQK